MIYGVSPAAIQIGKRPHVTRKPPTDRRGYLDGERASGLPGMQRTMRRAISSTLFPHLMFRGRSRAVIRFSYVHQIIPPFAASIGVVAPRKCSCKMPCERESILGGPGRKDTMRALLETTHGHWPGGFAREIGAAPSRWANLSFLQSKGAAPPARPILSLIGNLRPGRPLWNTRSETSAANSP